MPNPFRMTGEVNADGVRAILGGTETQLEEGSLTIALRLWFGGKAPVFPPGSRHVGSNGAIVPVRMFPFLWDVVAACSRLLRGRDQREEVRLHPTFYAIEISRKGDAVRVALFSWEGGEHRELADTQLSALELGGVSWMLANSILEGISQRNPRLKGNPLIQGFSSSVRELSDLLLQRGWQGPFLGRG